MIQGADMGIPTIVLIKARLWPSLMQAVAEYPSLADAMDESNYDCVAYTEEDDDRIRLVIYDVPPTIH